MRPHFLRAGKAIPLTEQTTLPLILPVIHKKSDSPQSAQYGTQANQAIVVTIHSGEKTNIQRGPSFVEADRRAR